MLLLKQSKEVIIMTSEMPPLSGRYGNSRDETPTDELYVVETPEVSLAPVTTYPGVEADEIAEGKSKAAFNKIYGKPGSGAPKYTLDELSPEELKSLGDELARQSPPDSI